jgi:hypothetical protein
MTFSSYEQYYLELLRLNPEALRYLMLHCTATPEGRVVTPGEILKWHTSPKPNGRGWDKVGYMVLFLLDGSTHFFAKDNGDQWVQSNEITNGAIGMNGMSHHACYVGGLSKDGKTPKDTRTPEQEMAMIKFIFEYLSRHPQVKVCGHNQFAKKACPSFDVPDWCKLINVPEVNIYRLAA